MRKSLAEFVDFWKVAALTENQGKQSHFNELCVILGEPRPTDHDPDGERYTFEKHVNKTDGGKGFADVWFRDHFAWEYKGPHKDLKAAYKQLNDYREDLLNPPLLVVSDFDRFEIHTNFPNTKKRVYAFNLSDIERNQVTAACPLPPLDVLHALFGDYRVLHPSSTDARVTQDVALLFTRLAERLELEERNLGATKEQIAHFLMRLLFCLFADSVELLPQHLFRNLIQSDDRFYPKRFLRKLSALFAAMSLPDGIFGEHTIKYFNGGLFDSSTVIELDKGDLGILYKVAANYDWSHIAPAIFGTLFERGLDPARRSLIGAHYTSEEDILLLIEPVVMRPLQQRWAHVRDSILVSLGLPTTTEPAPTARPIPAQGEALGAGAVVKARAESPAHKSRSLLTSNPEAERLLAAWFDELAAVRILDPACGSGNFLYVALRRLLDLWKQARDFAIEHHIQLAMQYAVEKMVSPSQLFGIETEFYAHELASIVVWIGFLQWKHEHGISEDREPILQKLDNIQHADAILRYNADNKSPEHPDGKPYEPTWPAADFIISNPPFLGGTQMRTQLGDKYCDDLRALYEGRVKGAADLVVYWFEKARADVGRSPATQVGLLATQGIRGGANQLTLRKILETQVIFWAWSDRNWVLDGAAVHVSMIGFTASQRTPFQLNGEEVGAIHADLTSAVDTTQAFRLPDNAGICFEGTKKHGAFDIDATTARKMLQAPLNPNGRHNSDVVKRWINALDVTRRSRDMYIIDFGTNMSSADAALYEMPFEYLKVHVLPKRAENRRESRKQNWWLHGETNPGMRAALLKVKRYVVTPRVAKHRLFAWEDAATLPDSATCIFARQDDYFFGMLHSMTHELWARKMGTQLREAESGFRYTPKTTFDTFPFPWPPGKEPSESKSPRVKAIADAARSLVSLRDAWLNPPNASEADLKDRTLTKLYNLRAAGKCAWLENAHRALDQAVFAAYDWPLELNGQALTTQQILANLLALNHQRAAAQLTEDE